MKSIIKFESGLPIIYRYRNASENSIDELKNSYVYFPNRTQLNDPFDCYPQLMYISKDSKKLRKFVEKSIQTKGPKLSRKDRRYKTRQLGKSDDEIRGIISDTFQEIINKFGIGCFTLSPSNFMMWSHYSNFHKGLCLQFNLEFDKTFFKGINKVNYVEEFERAEYSPQDESNIEHLFYTKSIMWSMEHEIRVIKNSYGKHYFKPESLTGIMFGLQAEQKFIIEVMNICEDKYPNLKYYKSFPAEDFFGIILQEVHLNKNES
jgi:hypothetical protein